MSLALRLTRREWRHILAALNARIMASREFGLQDEKTFAALKEKIERLLAPGGHGKRQ